MHDPCAHEAGGAIHPLARGVALPAMPTTRAATRWRVTDPALTVTQYVYDEFDRRVSETVDPAGLI